MGLPSASVSLECRAWINSHPRAGKLLAYFASVRGRADLLAEFSGPIAYVRAVGVVPPPVGEHGRPLGLQSGLESEEAVLLLFQVIADRFAVGHDHLLIESQPCHAVPPVINRLQIGCDFRTVLEVLALRRQGLVRFPARILVLAESVAVLLGDAVNEQLSLGLHRVRAAGLQVGDLGTQCAIPGVVHGGIGQRRDHRPHERNMSDA